MILDDFFQRIVVISLPRCKERADRAISELREKGLSETARVIRAVDGKVCRPTDWWRASESAWGCMQSHYRIVQEALEDGVETLLVLEDDAVWQADPVPLVRQFMAQVPQDWGQIYFGGQHRSNHRPAWLEGRPAVLRAHSVHRTHAYAIHRRAMVAFLKHIIYAPDYLDAFKKEGVRRHIDHQLEEAHRRRDWPVYAPSWWLAAQGENLSTISGKQQPTQWWHLLWNESHRKLPVVVVPESTSPEQARWLHFGAARHRSETDPVVDVGIEGSVTPRELISNIEMVAKEAVGLQRLPAMKAWPEKVEWLKKQWAGGVLELPSAGELERLCDFPVSRLIEHPWICPPEGQDQATKAGGESVCATEAPTLHQVWIGQNPMPPRLEAYCAKLRAAFPGWKYKFWTEADMPDLASGSMRPDIVLGEPDVHFGIRVDVVRLEVLRQFGGVYVDVDFEPLRDDLTPLFEREGFVYSDERSGRPTNSVMGSLKPDNPIVNLYLRRIFARLRPVTDKWDVIKISGPEMLAEVLNFWVFDWKSSSPMLVANQQVGGVYGGGTISGIWREFLHPYTWDEGTWQTFDPKKFPQAWAAHHWAGLWQEGKAD